MGAKITVVLPAHNTEPYVGAAIQSVLNQTYDDFELWVLENGSTDQTAEVAQRFTDDHRVKVFQLGAVGFQGALQFALDNASSEFLARMDSDDLILPNRFEIQMKVFQEHPELAMVGSNFAVFTPFNHFFEHQLGKQTGEITLESMIPAPLPNSNKPRRFFADSSVIYRREAALEVGGYDSDFTMGDVPLWIRILQKGRGLAIAEPLYVQRLRPDSFSKTHSEGVYVRAKYMPQYVKDPEGWIRNTPTRDPVLSFWSRIARLEMLVGDRHILREIADQLERCHFSKQARGIKLRSYGGKWVSRYYRWRTRNAYRYRLDWHSMFSYIEKEAENFA